MTRGLQVWVKDPTGGKGTVRSAETGRFIPRDARGIIDNFDRLARVAQANVVENMSESFLRPRASTGRLLRVTASPRNRIADQFGFGVGVTDYLDRSEAKYWRTIEEGSAVAWADSPGGRSSMIGMTMRGKFGGSIVGWRESSWGPRPVAGPKWNAMGGTFNAMRKLPEVTITQEIRPMHAYAEAYREDGVFSTRATRVVNQYLQEVLERAIRGR